MPNEREKLRPLQTSGSVVLSSEVEELERSGKCEARELLKGGFAVVRC